MHNTQECQKLNPRKHKIVSARTRCLKEITELASTFPSLPVSPGVIATSRHNHRGVYVWNVLPAIRVRLVWWWATQKVEPEGHPHGGKAGLRSLGGDLLISNCLGKLARISLDDPP